MRTLTYSIPEAWDSSTVLRFLKGKAGLSSKLIRTLKQQDNGLLLNGEHARTIDPVHTGDVLVIHIPGESSNVESVGFDPNALHILYEDEDFVVINKPAGLAVHPSHNHQGDTLANLLAAHLEQEGRPCAFRAIGRLDKGTSGIMVCALNPFAASKLHGNLHKTYFALPGGHYEGRGTIDAPIYRPDDILTVRTVDPRGDRAITHWEALATGRVPLHLGEKNPKHRFYNDPPQPDEDGLLPATLVKVHLETGRTHQIRVHFASLGTPLLGDTMYGYPRTDITHQALHCGSVSLVHPYTEEPMHFEVPLPEDMQQLAELLTEEPFGGKI